MQGVSFDFSGRVVLVTGGATGIGAEVVRQFAASGAAVYFSYTTNAVGARAVQEEARRNGARVLSRPCDLGRLDEVDALIRAAEAELGPVDHLINVSGITDPTPVLAITPEVWDRTLDINLRGVFFACRQVAQGMIDRGRQGGCILLTGSVHGLVAGPDHAHYEASKGGLAMLARSLATEFGPHGIRVNCVSPGPIEVERYARMERFDRDRWSAEVPLRRVGTPADVAPLYLFLCTEAASYITGQSVYVDGGVTSRMISL